MPRERLSIVQVTPFAWEQSHDVNRFVERLSAELRDRGHRVAIVAPTASRELARATRGLVARLESEPDVLWADGSGEALLGVGPFPPPPRRAGGPLSLPIEASHTVETFMDHAELDFVHVHEPFAPSAGSAALRHSRALNVGTFHWASERTPALQVPRRFTRHLLGRLDGRTASFEATRRLVESRYPGRYRIVGPGADAVEHGDRVGGGSTHGEEIEILYLAEEERSAARLFLRALRRLGTDLPWRAVIRAPEVGTELGPPPSRALRDRVRIVPAAEVSAADALATADVVVAASSGVAASGQLPLRALAAGAIPVVARLPQYEEAVGFGDRGLLFEPRDAETLAAQLRRLVEDGALRSRLATEVERAAPGLAWTRVADDMEELYGEIAARRHSTGNPSVRRRLSSRPLIDVDLHMHTDHSPDCATPVDVLLDTAKARGLDAIAITDHNEISGALEARERADGIKVIVAEEVKTAEQGEVIGLFIEEKIPRGLTLEETIAEIHRQGGLAYVPHPFDRMHSVPDYEHLLPVVHEIDAIEVFNPRVAFTSFNEEAERFAAKYRIAGGAGSDSHVAQGLGSVKISMRDFDGPEEFLESLRDADIVRHRQSLLYVQALKFLQTKARPARAVRRERAAETSEGAAGDPERALGESNS
ncbi:MAG: glycosyltransferase [Thermoleophilaceae bacterium]|nr:glycosyltransferase [Thermoleophilaceae bacterium]